LNTSFCFCSVLFRTFDKCTMDMPIRQLNIESFLKVYCDLRFCGQNRYAEHGFFAKKETPPHGACFCNAKVMPYGVAFEWHTLYRRSVAA
ncbi:MAG: hypothetical protein RR900_07495, partial [Ruthenibacterium sp.]